MSRLPTRTIALYNLPPLAGVLTVTLFNFYFLKYATDVLLVAPAVIGAIVAATRLIDAFTDVLVGYLSDRTGARLGRRRPWLLAAMVPAAIAFVALWRPPLGWSPQAVQIWLGATVFLLFLALTALAVPHAALGAELSLDHHDRTRIFAGQQVATALGMVLGLVGMFVLISNKDDPRGVATMVSLVAGALIVITISIMCAKVRERSEFSGRGATSSLVAIRDVFRNPHARVHLGVHFLANLGAAMSMMTVPYHAQYIVGNMKLASLFALAAMVPAALSPPAWSALSRRIGKKRARIAGMLLYALSFGSAFFVQQGDVALMVGSLVFVGVAMGGGLTLGLSIQADIIDYDEWRSGQRKEGVYLAAWTLLIKLAMGIAAAITGAALQGIGFIPNVAQPANVRLALRGMHTLSPLAANVLSALLFTRYRLDSAKYAEIRGDLDARASKASDRQGA